MCIVTVAGAREEPVREVSGLITAAFVGYVRRARGEDATVRVAAAIGRKPEEITNTAWFSVDELRVVAESAATECCDSDIGRRGGEAAFWDFVGGIDDILIASGSPESALALLLEFGARFWTGREFTVSEAAPGRAVIHGSYLDPGGAVPAFCNFSAALYGLLPSLFGYIGTTVEAECQLRGDSECRFEVCWLPDARAAAPDVIASEARAEAAIDQLERLRQMAAELAEVDDAQSALAKVVEQASAVVQAPRYLVRVILDDADAPRVHQYGFPAGTDVELLAHRLFVDGGIDDYDALVVDIVSARRRYGSIAALFPTGREFMDTDRRMLEAYAGHAAAALDALVALDTARRHRDTAAALLDLARALAEVGSTEETIERLVAAIPPVLGCIGGRIWLHDDGGAAIADAAEGRPAILDRRDAPLAVRDAMPHTVTRVAIAPIVVRDESIGVVVAGIAAEKTTLMDRDLVDRLTGLADHAATALDNARLLERVHHDALHDRLTGLPNRALIEDRVDAALRRADRDGAWPRLLFIDLDRFKNVNDTLGHRAGDTLICQAALRLGEALRSGDTLGRLGGDEFVVLLEGCPTGAVAEHAAERLGAAMQAPFTIDGKELYISCSIGIAQAPAHGKTYEQLLQHADVAMFDAKRQGRGTFSMYAPHRSGPRRDRLDLDSRLHRALDNGELVVLYQPQVDLDTLEIVGAEALVRWDHRDLGRLTPDQFLPLAEESGLIVDIDRWVRAEAFAQAARWHTAGLDWSIAVNVSTAELDRHDIATRIASEVAAAGIPPSSVEIEVTDRVVLSEEALAEVVSGLRGVGLRVAIDDFGTGTSILGRLRSCSIDTLKIDRSFVSEIGSTGGDTILRALVPLGRSLDLKVIAEGIETTDQAALLRGLGCPVGQGYLFSRPVEASTLTAQARPRIPDAAV